MRERPDLLLIQIPLVFFTIHNICKIDALSLIKKNNHSFTDTSTISATTPDDELSEKSESLNNDETHNSGDMTAAVTQTTLTTELHNEDNKEKSEVVSDTTPVLNDESVASENANTTNNSADKPLSEVTNETKSLTVQTSEHQANAQLVSDASQLTADTDNSITAKTETHDETLDTDLKTETHQTDEITDTDLGGKVEALVSDGAQATNTETKEESLASSQSLPQPLATQVEPQPSATQVNKVFFLLHTYI